MLNVDVKIDTRMLEKLEKALGDIPALKVGVLGDGRNAYIGAVHEFGLGDNPRRSWLEEPLNDRYQDTLEASKLLEDKKLEEKIIAQGWEFFMEKLGVVALTVVNEGFATNGFGKWDAWSKGYKSKTGQILVDTTQLRDSVTYQIVPDPGGNQS